MDNYSDANSDVLEAGLKIILVGDTAVGKSCICNRIINSAYNENVKATVGCDYFEKDFPLPEGRSIKLSIWDTAGQERFRGLASSYYKKARGIIICYDITRKSSFTKISYWMEEIESFAPADTPLFLLGCKLDLENRRQIELADAQKFASRYGFAHFEEVSALESVDDIREFFEVVVQKMLEKGESKALGMRAQETQNDTESAKAVKLKEGGGDKKGCCS
jgi:small GTP-binding protein